MKNKLNLPYFLVAVLFLFGLFMLCAFVSSCSKYTQTTATEQTQKALIKYPLVVAKVARDNFPCVTQKNDTIIAYNDSLIYVDCPSIVNGTTQDYNGTDTVYLNKVVTKNNVVKVPVYLPVKTVTVTKTIEDSAKIFQLNNSLLQSVNETAKANDKIEKLEFKIANKNKWLYIFLAAFLISAFINYLQFRRKK